MSKGPLQDLIHPQVDSLDDVPTVIKHPFDIFRIDGAREMGVAVMSTVLFRVPARGLLRNL